MRQIFPKLHIMVMVGFPIYVHLCILLLLPLYHKRTSLMSPNCEWKLINHHLKNILIKKLGIFEKCIFFFYACSICHSLNDILAFFCFPPKALMSDYTFFLHKEGKFNLTKIWHRKKILSRSHKWREAVWLMIPCHIVLDAFWCLLKARIWIPKWAYCKSPFFFCETISFLCVWHSKVNASEIGMM